MSRKILDLKLQPPKFSKKSNFSLYWKFFASDFSKTAQPISKIPKWVLDIYRTFQKNPLPTLAKFMKFLSILGGSPLSLALRKSLSLSLSLNRNISRLCPPSLIKLSKKHLLVTLFQIRKPYVFPISLSKVIPPQIFEKIEIFPILEIFYQRFLENCEADFKKL